MTKYQIIEISKYEPITIRPVLTAQNSQKEASELLASIISGIIGEGTEEVEGSGDVYEVGDNVLRILEIESYRRPNPKSRA
jgi:hypothetical protein